MNMITTESNEEYHGNTGAISVSGLKQLKRSPAHYWARYLDPNRQEKEETAAMKFGTATHCAILQPEEFDDKYTVIPEGLDRRTKEGKEIWKLILDSGKTPIPGNDWVILKGILESCLKFPELQEILTHESVAFEHSVYFDWYGTPCKFRPDATIAPCERWPHGLILDLKTTQDAGSDFIRSVWRYDYHMQQAFYCEGFMRMFDTLIPPDFVFLAQETDAPYANAMYYLPDDLVEYGMNQCVELLALYNTCRDADQWPGYARALQCLQMPGWMDRVVNASDEEIEGISYVTE
jgi:exodeoxyribonuclease VIII